MRYRSALVTTAIAGMLASASASAPAPAPGPPPR
jgi:hypothetical protein